MLRFSGSSLVRLQKARLNSIPLNLNGLVHIVEYATDAPQIYLERDSTLLQHEHFCRENSMQHLHGVGNVIETRKVALSEEEHQQVRDAHIIKSICRVLESQVWGPNTELLLRPYAPDLSPQVVASVVLKQENLSIAKDFFGWSGWTIQSTPHVYNALLIKIGEAKLFDQMWQLLQEMKGKGCLVSGTSLSIIIKAYGAAGMPKQAWETLKRASEFDVCLDAHVYTTILVVLFKAGMLVEANAIYRKMVEEDCVFDASVWSTLICGWSKNGLIAEAEGCWLAMSNSGIEPTLRHYNAFIEGLCKSNCLSKALSKLIALKEKGLKPNAYTYNPILAALCKAGRFAEAYDMFRGMKDVCMPNQATFNMLLEGLCLDSDVSKAVELYDWLEEQGCVDSRGYFLLAAGLQKAKKVDKLISVFENLHAKHGVVNVWLCTSLLHCLIDQSDISQATAYFNRMRNGLTHPDVVWYATMINGYCKAQMIDEAIKLLSSMTVKPNAFCYGPLISAVLKAGKVSKGLSLFKDMLSKGIAPNSVVCNFLLKKLSDAGMMEECLWLLTYICKGRLQLNNVTVEALMECLDEKGGPQKAKEVYETLKNRRCLPKDKLRERRTSNT